MTLEEDKKKPKNPWAGRLRSGVDPLVQKYTRSIDVDRRMALHDVRGSRAHVRMLESQKLLFPEEAKALLEGLDQVEEEIRQGVFPYRDELEDIHMNIEVRLRELIGEGADRLHMGRSRNDQVAVDVRLYCLEEAEAWREQIASAIDQTIQLAERHVEDLFPGWTHLQAAQPVSWAHYLLSFCEMLHRDYQRLCHYVECHSVSPLGAGALSGSSLSLAPEWSANELGFERSFRNSYDVVGDRDSMLELAQIGTQLMIHLSRFAEDGIYFSSTPLRWIDLPDAICTGSSMMPQKKNPDALELMRGKTASVIGHATALATLLKGLPTSYNRDLQQDKVHLFPLIDIVSESLEIFTLVMAGMRIRVEASASALRTGFLMATELAEFLVEKGIPFRQAHHKVGSLVAYCVEHELEFEHLTPEQIREILPEAGKVEGITEVLQPRAAVTRRKYLGSTGEDSVRTQLEFWKEWLGKVRS